MESSPPSPTLNTSRDFRKPIGNLYIINNSFPGFKVNSHFIASIIEKPTSLIHLKQFNIDPNGSELIVVRLESQNNEMFFIILQQLSNGTNDIVFVTSDKLPQNTYKLRSMFVINLPDNSLKNLSDEARKYLSDIKSHFSGSVLNADFVQELIDIPNYDVNQYLDGIIMKLIQNPNRYFLDVGGVNEKGIHFRRFKLHDLIDEKNYVILNVIINNVPVKLGIFRERLQVPDYAAKFNVSISKISRLGFGIEEENIRKKMIDLRTWQKNESLKLSPSNAYMK